MKVIQLIDSLDYVKNNCWQHQIIESLSQQCELQLVELKSMGGVDFSSADAILSTLKLRTIDREATRIKSIIGSLPIFVYDQDPWEAFVDGASFHGAYQKISKHLNVKSFLNTSDSWVEYVKSRGFPSKLVRMWVLPRYCDEGIEWSQRPIDVGFMGTLHQYRKNFFDQLRVDFGIKVQVSPPGDYQAWLDSLSKTKFFIHNEDDKNWSINGEPIERNNCCWAKEIEVAARGCFVLRKWDPECQTYYSDKIPTILTFNDLKEIPKLINKIEDDLSVSSLASKQGVDFIRSRPAWQDLYQELANANK
jgi:hypothetical protein